MEGSASGQPGAIRHSQHHLRQDFDLHLVEMRNTHLSTGIDEMCAKVLRNLVQIMTSSDICSSAGGAHGRRWCCGGGDAWGRITGWR